MSIKHWPAGERPRERLLRQGPMALSDAELLALLLRTGQAGRSAVELARELVATAGGLAPLLDTDLGRLTRLPGLGPAKAASIKAALELAGRYLADGGAPGEALCSSTTTQAYLKVRLAGHSREVFAVLFLDNRHRVLCFEEMFAGTLAATPVFPREVIRRALALNAAAVILAHNHPSGCPEPSPADIALTTRVREAAALVELRVLDHVVVARDGSVSLAERGLAGLGAACPPGGGMLEQPSRNG